MNSSTSPELRVLAEEPAALQQRVLPTLNVDGSRRYLYPKVAPGRFFNARRVLAYGLIGLFTALPYLEVGGKPALFLDVVHRRFQVLGTTYLATDTLLFLTLMLTLFLGIFLVTALFGRAWCGWACPQTVYLEFLYRPLERLVEGSPRERQKRSPWARQGRRALKYGLYVVCSLYLAHTFLAYFVSVDALRGWVTQSPAEHPAAFAVMAATTALMLINFGNFREQTCMVACPYGRFQSVLLDRRSLIVGYDASRGEPRGRKRRAALPLAGDAVSVPVAPAGMAAASPAAASPAAPEKKGDCVDCGACVAACPTGVDIRDGLQMECIHCTQCIDACDRVMDKLGRPRGLIRYTSKDELDGQPRQLLRWRTVVYPLLMAGALATFAVAVGTRAPAVVTVLRGIGTPFTVTPTGEVTNQLRVKINNRSEKAAAYTIALVGAEGARLIAPENPLQVPAGETRETSVFVLLPVGSLHGGMRDVQLRVSAEGFETRERYRLLGPSAPVGVAKGAVP